jgi:hypothetical protein
MMKKLIASLSVLPVLGVFAAVSEISVDLKLDFNDYVSGERIRGVVDIANSSPDKVSVGYSNSEDLFFIEVYRAGDMERLGRAPRAVFVSPFMVKSGEGQKLETFLGDHYSLREPRRYLAKPVLVHRGVRYEGAYRAFDVVEGVKIGGAMQMFANRRGLHREFALVHWSRNGGEHIFLGAADGGSGNSKWETRDLGPILRIDEPVISVLQNGEVVVIHRYNAENYIRSSFWSLPDTFEFRTRELVRDPHSAGTARVRELYKEKGIAPKHNPWWKFW